MQAVSKLATKKRQIGYGPPEEQNNKLETQCNQIWRKKLFLVLQFCALHVQFSSFYI